MSSTENENYEYIFEICKDSFIGYIYYIIAYLNVVSLGYSVFSPTFSSVTYLKPMYAIFLVLIVAFSDNHFPHAVMNNIMIERPKNVSTVNPHN